MIKQYNAVLTNNLSINLRNVKMLMCNNLSTNLRNVKILG